MALTAPPGEPHARGPAAWHDAIVVGAGATGSWAAMDLTARGHRVLLLEAGGTAGDRTRHGAGGRAESERRQPQQRQSMGYGPGTAARFVDDLDEPYATPPEQPFCWIRNRAVGGRLHTWARHCPRFSDRELRAAQGPGGAPAWPLGYDELEPYYARAERVLGVQDGEDAARQASGLNPAELRFKETVERKWPDRRVLAARLAAPGCAERMQGAALATGRLSLRSHTSVHRIVAAAGDRRARGVECIDRRTGEVLRIDGRVIVLCASTIESVRILLSSACPAHPQGWGNSSGELGRGLMDHLMVVARGSAGSDGVSRRGGTSDDLGEAIGFYIPRFASEARPGPGSGYGLQGGIGSPRPERSERHGFFLAAFGEAPPRPQNRIVLDRARRDRWGVPVVRIEYAPGEEALALAAEMQHGIREMTAQAGLRLLREPRLATPGLSSHELGGARMGSDPATSVLDEHNRCWDSANVFVTDGACFPTAGHQNPTLTMLALTARACEAIEREIRAG